MKRVGVLPSIVTLGNTYCGLLAIFKVADGQPYTASWLILLAMVFDVLDGKIARIAGTSSHFGAYLDSLSDAISFGVAPAFLAKVVCEGTLPPKLLTALTAIFAVGAVLRLARYNVEHASGEGSDREGKEVNWFAGLPTPGGAGVVASAIFLLSSDEHLFSLDFHWIRSVLPFACGALGCLMVSRIPYLHFGNRFLRGRKDFGYFFLVAIVLLFLVLRPHEAVFLGFFAYALSGPAVAPFQRAAVEEAEADNEPAEKV